MDTEHIELNGPDADASPGALSTFVTGLIATVQPDVADVRRHIIDLQQAHPGLSREELAEKWADRVCWRYASEGAATALPGAIPGLGTAVMVGVEAVAISADLAYMIRCMAGLTIGVGVVFDRDVDASFNQDFVRVLGLWCGVLNLTKPAVTRVATKVAVAQFKRLPAEIFKRINQRVGTTIVTKYGVKRGGIAIGRLIPFGVGALVGGGFNLATMKAFKASALSYYGTDNGELFEAEG
jgi:hypothetical protein